MNPEYIPHLIGVVVLVGAGLLIPKVRAARARRKAEVAARQDGYGGVAAEGKNGDNQPK